MGILADVFVAQPDHASDYPTALNQPPPDPARFERVEFKGLLDLNFSMLWAIIADEPWELDQHALPQEWMKDDGEEWIFRFPDAFVARLAALDAATQSRVAERWAQTEELSDWPRSELEPVVRDLARLARTALAKNAGLYLWGSL